MVGLSPVIIVPPLPLRWATAPIVAHGLTDLFEEGWPVAYLAAALIPFAGSWACAAAASAWHLSDGGRRVAQATVAS